MDPTDLIPLPQVAGMAGLHRATVSAAMWKGEIEAVNIGGRWFTSRAEAVRWIAARHARRNHASETPVSVGHAEDSE